MRGAPRLAGRALVKAYRYTLSPLVGFHCRHLPTCSDYADQALDRFGLWAGGWMTLARLMRCQPWGTSGVDFVCDVVARTGALVHAMALRALARDEWRQRTRRDVNRLISPKGRYYFASVQFDVDSMARQTRSI